eukprot:1143871-Pelagomonas_calceolata.AAC.8
MRPPVCMLCATLIVHTSGLHPERIIINIFAYTAAQPTSRAATVCCTMREIMLWAKAQNPRAAILAGQM